MKKIIYLIKEKKLFSYELDFGVLILFSLITVSFVISLLEYIN